MTKLFDYNLTGTGWAEVTLSDETQSVTFEVSYLSDPLSELYEGLYRLTQNQSDKEIIVFADEPGEHSLIIAKQDYLNLEIELYKNDEWEELSTAMTSTKGNKELIYSDKDTLQNFISKICDGTDNLLKRLTLSEYKKLWSQYDFPIEIYGKIRQPKLLT